MPASSAKSPPPAVVGGAKGRPELPGQGSLRGIAAMTVFIAHAEFFNFFPDYPRLRSMYHVFYWHSAAVDLFFVLSGFILYYVYSARRFSWWDYGVARFSRIYPLYIVTLAATLGMSLYAFHQTGHRDINLNLPTMLTNLFLVQDWPLLPHFVGPNRATWSISVEVFLYIFLFPFLMSLHKHVRNEYKWLFIIVPVVLQAVIYHTVSDINDSTVVANPWAPFRGILCFTSGFFLCSWWLEKKPSRSMPKVLETVLLIAIASSLLFEFPIDRSLAVLTFPLLVYLSALKESVLSRVLAGRIFYWLGDLSYSIYILHLPILKATGVLLGLRKLGQLGGVGYLSLDYRIFCFFATIASVLIVAHISHFYFERPVIRWMKKRLDKDPASIRST